jgi:hypothetical protein
MRSPLTDILAEGLEQLRGAASVQPKRWRLHPAMRLKPIAEGSDKSWIGVLFPNWFTRADAAAHQALMEKLHSKTRVIGDLCSLVVRAPTTAKMTNKSMKSVEIDLCQKAASPLNEAAQMGGGSNVSNGAGQSVSFAFEVICERVYVWSTDSTPQAS